MYDENELYDEVMGVGKKAVQAPKKVIDGIKNTAHTVDSLKKLIDSFKGVSSGQDISQPISFMFTGQSTDLRYFLEHNEMPIQLIENIPDENLKNAVKDEFNKAAASGKVNISNGKITITPQGKEFIARPQFRSAAAQDVQHYQAAMSNVQGFMLNGTEQDLHYFAHAESLDLQKIFEHPDKEAVQRVLSNIKAMEDNGLVYVDRTLGTVKATEKGQEVIAKEAAKGTVKETVSKSAVIGSTGTTAVATTGTAATTATVAGETAVTAGTAAGAGAPTGGVGAIFVVVADVGIKAVTKATQVFTGGAQK